MPALDPEFLLPIILMLNMAFMAGIALYLHLLWKEASSKPDFDLPDETMMKQAKEKSQGILERALKQANKIIANAELKGISLFSREKVDVGKITDVYEKDVKDLETAMEKHIHDVVATTQKSHEEFIAR